MQENHKENGKKMRKEKRKGIKFNPADYDYMDNMSMPSWRWEFIRRTKDYPAFYEKWHRQMQDTDEESKNYDPKVTEEYLSKYSPTFPNHPDNKWKPRE